MAKLTSTDCDTLTLATLKHLIDGESYAFRNGWRDNYGRLLPGAVIYRLFSSGYVEFGPKRTLRITDVGREAFQSGRAR
jgi:hypothetical protein